MEAPSVVRLADVVRVEDGDKDYSTNVAGQWSFIPLPVWPLNSYCGNCDVHGRKMKSTISEL
ncbi:hypothetical protein BG74_02865 [Sodalis-like endosymbiont of Proechinophthirus fluctus]|uniref:hypothetical protein n=1 Tax=Sodalis-like endosymbiont of Proechinophthirus fluctus TaxID=1462730 RepID=UPI0007A877A7|nr:hypothetical protein [Sodalis-like endosymbiont of Proechinophthirus fluctus]KYP97464.1 hypothetical protein BG74_02865 [Sodalis-like endosymbiont of Proechinophthirus fluctus]